MANLHVEWPQQPFNGTKLGLDFDNQESGRSFVPGQDVDRAAVCEVSKRHLDLGRPPEAREPSDDLAHEKRMRLVEDTIELCSMASQPQLQSGSERIGDRKERTARQLLARAGLEPLDRSAGQSGLAAKLGLGQAVALSEDANDSTEFCAAHVRECDLARLRDTS